MYENQGEDNNFYDLEDTLGTITHLVDVSIDLMNLYSEVKKKKRYYRNLF